MNNDEQFENRLRRQPLRPIPPAWREEILTTAAVRQPATTARRGKEDATALVAGWRLLFARMPLAWAALAALWVGIVGVNLTMPGPLVSVAMEAPASAHYAALASLDSPAADFDADRAPSLPTRKASPAVRPSDVPLPPRSERRHGVDVGEMPLDFVFQHIA
jgi:hypothetical protein